MLFVVYLQVLLFAVWACFCLAVSNKLELGLDQTLSMPSDSFNIDYLHSVNTYVSAGKLHPPSVNPYLITGQILM